MRLLILGIFFSINLLLVTFVYGQKEQIDSLEKVLSKTNSNREKYDLLINIGQHYEKQSPQTAMKYYRQALSLAERLNNDTLRANSLYNLAIAYDVSQKYKQAKELYRKSLRIYCKQKDSIHIADLYKNLGGVFLLTSVYDSAMYYELQALRIYQQFNDFSGLMDSYIALGGLSTEIENFIEAEYYFEQAMNFADKINNDEYRCVLHNNIGMSFSKQKNYEIALLNYKKALQIAKKEKFNIYLGDIYQNIANEYLLMNQTDIALSYFYKAKEYFEKQNDIGGIFDVSIGLAKLYYKTKYFRIAYGFLLSAKSIQKNYSSYLSAKNSEEFYDIYSKVLFKINQPANAYKALIKKELYRDSFFSERKVKLVYELEFKYQTISKNKTIKDLQEINFLNQRNIANIEAKRKAEQKVAYLLVIIGIILIVASLWIYLNFLRNRKLSLKIQEKNRKINEAQEKLKRIVDFLPVVFFEANSKGDLVFKNQNFYEVTSITEDIGGLKAYIEFIKPQYRRNLIDRINELVRTKEVQTIEFEFERRDGTSFWALLTIAVNEIRGNKEFYGMVIDISERKKIEQDLLLLKTSVEQSESPLMITDSNPKILYVNPAYIKITGYTEKELLGKNPSILKSDITAEKIYIDLWNTITAGKVWKGIFINKRRNGEFYSDRTIITPVKNKHGVITHFVANKEDITKEAKKNEKILQLYTATENSPNSVMILDADMKITYVNKAFEKITGYSADEVLGLNPNFLDSGRHDNEVIDILKDTIYTGNIWQGMLVNKRKNGEDYWNSSTVIPLLNEDEKLIGFVCNDIDITNQIKTQEELMDTMEQLNEKNKEIVSSIRYAERIQKVMMSNETEVRELFPNSFIIFLPRDIISGDFFWVSKIQDKHFVAIVDCTGHSVPGAFLSIIGINLLESAINERKIAKPSDVLSYMSEKLLGILSNPYTMEHIKDDMEVALAEIDYHKKELIFASSRNRLYFISDKPVIIKAQNGISVISQNDLKIMYKFNGDREFLGSKADDKRFTDYVIEIKDNDMLYFSSDGYYDQFGGVDNVKYKRKRFEQRLFDISDLPIDEQKDSLLDEFEIFKGSFPQTDDVTVMGIKIKF